MPRCVQARFPTARGRGFTLLEIMVVIALIGLLATVLAVGASSMLRDRPETPESVVWTAIGEARKFALQHETEVWLSFEAQERDFVAMTPLGMQRFAVPANLKFDLSFLGTGKGGQSVLIGGRLVETSTLAGVRFFPDGTCTPFRVQLVEDGRQPEILEVDPWTCAPVLKNEEVR